MLSVEELFQTGDPVDLVVGLEQPGLEVKKLIRGILEESNNNQVDHLALRSQE